MHYIKALKTPATSTISKFFPFKTTLTALALLFCSNIQALDYAEIKALANESTLFTFERSNYKPTKVLFYDILYNSKCQFQKDPLDPHYFDTSTNSRIELKDSSYFLPTFIDRLSNNHLRFSFRSLDELLGEASYIDTYITTDSNFYGLSNCQVWGFIEFKNQGSSGEFVGSLIAKGRL